MPTHAELSAKLLQDAATFFRTLAQHNAPLREQMEENASVFMQMADFLMNDPRGALEGTPIAQLSGRLLKDAATFFRELASQNEPIREQMNENANVYDQMGDLVMADPLGILD